MCVSVCVLDGGGCAGRWRGGFGSGETLSTLYLSAPPPLSATPPHTSPFPPTPPADPHLLPQRHLAKNDSLIQKAAFFESRISKASTGQRVELSGVWVS